MKFLKLEATLNNTEAKMKKNILMLGLTILLGQFASASSTGVQILRYYNQQTGMYRITSQRLGGWEWRSDASWLIENNSQGGVAIPIYECYQYNMDESFLTGSSQCEGAQAQAYFLGYIRQKPAQGYVQFFRCNDGRSHYASTDKYCERNSHYGNVITEGSLGFVRYN